MTNEEAIEYFNNHYEVNNKEQNDAVYLAVMALEKQIPKKPIDITEFMLGKIKGTEGDCECGKHLFFRDKYCPNCGQAIDWS